VTIILVELSLCWLCYLGQNASFTPNLLVCMVLAYNDSNYVAISWKWPLFVALASVLRVVSDLANGVAR
jgi:hypothetical protein